MKLYIEYGCSNEDCTAGYLFIYDVFLTLDNWYKSLDALEEIFKSEIGPDFYIGDSIERKVKLIYPTQFSVEIKHINDCFNVIIYGSDKKVIAQRNFDVPEDNFDKDPDYLVPFFGKIADWIESILCVPIRRQQYEALKQFEEVAGGYIQFHKFWDPEESCKNRKRSE